MADYENILWFNDWRRILKLKGLLFRGDTPWKSGTFNNLTNNYSWDRDKGTYLESDNSYMYHINNYIDVNGNLTENGKNWLNQNYLVNTRSTPENSKMLALLQNSVKSNYLFPKEGILRNGKTVYNWHDFIIGDFDEESKKGTGVSTDNNYSVAHNLNTGFGIYDSSLRLLDPKSDFFRKMYPEILKVLNLEDLDKIEGISKDAKEEEKLQKKTSQFINYRKIKSPFDVDLSFPNVYDSGVKGPPLFNIEQLESGLNIDPKSSYEKRTDVISRMNAKYPGSGEWLNGQQFDDYESAELKWLEYSKSKNNSESSNKNQVDPRVLLGIRVSIDNMFNTLNTENLIKNMDVALKNYTPIGKLVHGDYVSQLQAQREAARLINKSPLTSNALIQSAIDLEGVEKGNRLIEQGNLLDSRMYWNTADLAWALAKENTMKLDDLANYNRAALAEFNNKIAQLRFETNKQNMQNWDVFASDIEKEKLYELQIQKAKAIEAQDAFESLYDLTYGIDLSKYKDKYLDYDTTTDAEEKKKLGLQLDKLKEWMTALLTLNKFRRYGWSLEEFKKLYPQWEVDLTNFTIKQPIFSKFGGVLQLLQKGGGFGVQFTPTGSFSPYELLYGKGSKGSSTSEKKSKTSSSSDDSDDEDDKTKNQLMKNIAETLKGIDALDSDVSILTQQLVSFFDYSKYSLDDDPSKFYSMYVKALSEVNRAKQSAKFFNKSYDELKEKHALNSAAITTDGKVIVGVAGSTGIDYVYPEEYLKNLEKYHLLTNGEILELRRTNPNFAHQDKYLTEVAQNGTSLQDIEKYLKDFITGLGHDENSRDELTRRFGADTVQGLKTLQELILGKLTDAETAEIAASLNALGEFNVSTTTLTKLLINAVNSIFSFMPGNMKALLYLYSGGEEKAVNAVVSLISKGVSTKSEFKVNGFTELDEKGQLKSGSTKSGSGSGSGGSSLEESENRELLNIIEGVGGEYGNIVINPGTKTKLEVSSVNYNVEGAYEASSLSRALIDSKIIGISNPKNIYFGDLKLDSQTLSDVMYSGNGFSRVLLPIKSDGSPDFELFDRFEAACLAVRDSGKNPMNLKDQDAQKLLAKLLEGSGLYSLVTGGYPDLTKIGIFLVTEGLTSSKIGIKPSKFVKATDSLADYDAMRKALGLKVGNKFLEYDLDERNYYNPFELLGYSYDTVYKGTIYIPINNNPLQASTASGNKQKKSNAKLEEQVYQTSLALRRYNSNNEFKP